MESMAICTETETQPPPGGNSPNSDFEYCAANSGTWSVSGGVLILVEMSGNTPVHEQLKSGL